MCGEHVPPIGLLVCSIDGLSTTCQTRSRAVGNDGDQCDDLDNDCDGSTRTKITSSTLSGFVPRRVCGEHVPPIELARL